MILPNVLGYTPRYSSLNFEAIRKFRAHEKRAKLSRWVVIILPCIKQLCRNLVCW